MPHDSGPARPPTPPLAPDLTLVDLRAETTRLAEPLPDPGGRRTLPLGLDEIEDGAHGLTPASGPLLVVCERGTRAQLAARYLRADGLDAQAWPSNWASFVAALETS